jgi:hypothetical protein
MPTKYPSLAIGAKRRLELFRKEAANGKWARPMTWRDVRFATLTSETGLSQGFNGEGVNQTPVWYTQDGPEFRDEFDATHGVASIRHGGWYTDMHQEERAIGIVTRLPHGRFITGYRWTSNGERVYFPDLFDDAEDAARVADEHTHAYSPNANAVGKQG